MNLNDKQDMLTVLRTEFEAWEELLAGLSEAQLTARTLSADLSVKDIVGHLRAWQQITNARLEAALHNKEPEFTGWPPNFDSEPETDRINAWIHDTYRDQAWSTVYNAWRDGFLRVLDQTAAAPEEDLVKKGRYSWLGDYALAAVLEGTYEHHQEHLDELRPQLQA